MQATRLAQLLQAGHGNFPTVKIFGKCSKGIQSMSILLFDSKTSLPVYITET
jgi:hypothetical protein